MNEIAESGSFGKGLLAFKFAPPNHQGNVLNDTGGSETLSVAPKMSPVVAPVYEAT